MIVFIPQEICFSYYIQCFSYLLNAFHSLLIRFHTKQQSFRTPRNNFQIPDSCFALAHSPQTTREVRATLYSRLSQYSPHAAPCTCVGHFCPHGPGGGPPALHARFPSVPTSGVRSPVIHQFPPLGFDPRRDSIYDKSLTGEPILPSRTANQYLARYWFAVRDGKIGSPVRDLSLSILSLLPSFVRPPIFLVLSHIFLIHPHIFLILSHIFLIPLECKTGGLYCVAYLT
jgi:hypothetical protein